MESRPTERGFAIVTAIFVVIIIAGLSVAIVGSSTVQHTQAMQVTDRARSLALAEGAAALLLAELSDDELSPVRNTAAYAQVGNAYVRTYAPFDEADGQARIEISYSLDTGGVLTPVTFASRTSPVEAFNRVHASVTGIRPRSERTLVIDFSPKFILFNDAIVSDAVPLNGGGTLKNLAMNGHIVITDKGRPDQIFINGDLSANGGVYWEKSSQPITTEDANLHFSFAGVITDNLAGTPDQIADYTAPGSADQLFDFNRIIAAARAGAGQEYTTFADFKAAMNAKNLAGQPLEGITVLSIDTKTWGGLNSDHMTTTDIPGGINIRGTLLFNFAAGTSPTFKIWMELPVNINAADLSGLVPSDPATYTSGYNKPYLDPSKKPNAVVLEPTYASFTDTDDLPALMFNTGIVDQHGASNICGMIYGPSFIEMENMFAELQYFNGCVMGGAGVYIMGNATAGNTVINFDPQTIDLLATKAGRGRGLAIMSWRTLH